MLPPRSPPGVHGTRAPVRARAVETPVSDGNVGSMRNIDATLLLARGQERVHAILAEILAEHRAMREAQTAAHEHLLNTLVECHEQTLEQLLRNEEGTSTTTQKAAHQDLLKSQTSMTEGEEVAVGTALIFPHRNTEEDIRYEVEMANFEVLQRGDRTTPFKEEGPLSKAPPQKAQWTPEDVDIDSVITFLDNEECFLRHFRATSGMQSLGHLSVGGKGPLGWGAVCMIQGVPELVSRLRSRVESLAIYSALFMSMAVPMMVDPPDSLLEAGEGTPWPPWVHDVRIRVYLIALSMGSLFHMICILLSISFTDALSEAARDSDVYRMVTKGGATRALVTCKLTFRLGTYSDYMAMGCAVTCYVSWLEALIWGLIVLLTSYIAGKRLQGPLLRTASVFTYWEEGESKDDPFDIGAPLWCLKKRMEISRGISQRGHHRIQTSQRKQSQSMPSNLAHKGLLGGMF